MKLKNYLVALITLTLSGCVSIESVIKLVSRSMGLKETQKSESPLPNNPSPSKTYKQNKELLFEMYRVVFEQDPQTSFDFYGYLDALEQGASLEGIYQGLVRSESYRQKEQSSGASEAQVLSRFCKILSWVEPDLLQETQFKKQDAAPLPKPVEPQYTPPGTLILPVLPPVHDGLERPSSSPRPVPDPRQYEILFVGASRFTLKRVLASEFLKAIDERKDPRDLALWYATWAQRLSGEGIDFGLKDRNLNDYDFHYVWASKNPKDRLIWEVLNRIHRVLTPLDPR